VRDEADFDARRAAEPRFVRVTGEGHGMLLEPWRANSSTLAIAGVWAPRERLSAIALDLRRVAGSLQWSQVLSPLAAAADTVEYRAAGFEVMERIVAYTHALGRRARSPGHGVPVRPAVPADACRIAALDAEAFSEPWRYGEEDIRDMLERDLVLVVRGADAVEGYAAASRRGSTVSLTRIAVARSARRRGVGSALMAHVISWASSTGALGLSLCTQGSNEASRALYSSMGMREHDEELFMLRADALDV
jgi:ribosomal protein S18 acetylase RimI-like enzyme